MGIPNFILNKKKKIGRKKERKNDNKTNERLDNTTRQQKWDDYDDYGLWVSSTISLREVSVSNTTACTVFSMSLVAHVDVVQMS